MWFSLCERAFCSRLTLRKAGQVELFGETPNRLSARATVPNADRERQYYSANRRIAFQKRRQLGKRRFGGGGEIRTHEAFRPSGFQDRRNQPLCHPSGKLVIGDQQSVAKYSRNSKICSTGEYVHVNLSYAGAQENPTSNCRKGAKPVGDSGSRRILEPGEPIRKPAY
jgi:hypothetical protein